MTRAGAPPSMIVSLLETCRERLGELRETSLRDEGPATLLHAVDQALDAAASHLRHPRNLEAKTRIEQALVHLSRTPPIPRPAAAETTDSAPEAPGGLQGLSSALNEALSLLAVTGILDPSGLAGPIDLLRNLTEHPDAYASFRAAIRVAVERLAKIHQAQAESPDQDFAEASRLLEIAAVHLNEKLLTSEMADASPEPAASADSSPGLEEAEHGWSSGTTQSSLEETRPDEATLMEERTPERQESGPAENGGAGSPTQAAFVLPADADASLLSEFVAECREYIEGAEAALLTLEENPEDSEAINTVFRAFHTIKGTSGFLGLRPLTDLAHKAENLLSRARDKEIRCTGGYADLALRSIDDLKLLVEQVQCALSGDEPRLPEDYADLLQILADPEAAGVSDDPNDATIRVPRIGDLVVALGAADREQVENVANTAEGTPIGQALVKSQVASVIDVSQALRAQKKLARKPEDGVESSVRVRTDRLDRLIDMVGELVIAQSMVAQDSVLAGGGRPDLHRKVTHTGKIVRELQDLSMSMRMVPLKPTFQKMARLVRDLAHKSGRQVEFQSHGEDTEIDRNMVDVLADPLVHMIRNAVDHGIEFPAERENAGKPMPGRIELSAFNEGSNIVVQLRDDGRGLDRDKIVAKAISRGLIESDKGLAEADVYNLIFEPGFSTAERVTEVSGRGVGMDVVRRAIQSLHGRVEIQSEKGRGTVFTVKLPLTLAVTDGMLIRVGSQRFVLPTVAIHMSFRPDRGALSTIGGRAEMVMLRDTLVPVVRLHRLFGIRDALEDPLQALLVVIEDGSRRAALMVDELLGQQQVVAKSVGEATDKVLGIAGGAILGDGRVGLILDPTGVIALARGGVSPAETGMVFEQQLA